MNRSTVVALALTAALLGPGLVTGAALAGEATPPAVDRDDSTVIDLGDGIKVDICLYADLDDLLDDLAGEDANADGKDADTDEGLLDLTDGGVLGLDLVDELLDELGQESFTERKAKCDDPDPTPTPTTTTTPTKAPATTIIQRPTVTRSTTVYRSGGQTREIPRGAPETGGGPWTSQN